MICICDILQHCVQVHAVLQLHGFIIYIVIHLPYVRVTTVTLTYKVIITYSLLKINLSDRFASNRSRGN